MSKAPKCKKRNERRATKNKSQSLSSPQPINKIYHGHKIPICMRPNTQQNIKKEIGILVFNSNALRFQMIANFSSSMMSKTRTTG